MLRALCARRAVAALALKRFVAPPSDLIPKAAWTGDGRFAKIERDSDRIFVDSLTGEGIWLPAVGGGEEEIEASSVKKKRRKKMNKHKHKKLRRRDRYSKKKK